MVIKILGSGCKNCVTLGENAETALRGMGRNEEVIKITDKKIIKDYGVQSTPALVIDEQVVSTGKVLAPKEIAELLEGKN